MWQLLDRLLQATLLTAAASTVFVLSALVWSALQASDTTDQPVDPDEAVVEVRLSSHGDVSRLYVGQPLVVDVVLLNLQARRARNQAQVDPEGAAAVVAIPLDGAITDDLAWERRLTMTLSTPGGATVLNTLDWQARLLEGDIKPMGRRLGLAPMRTTFILDGEDLADLLPGQYVMRAALSPDIVSPSRVTSVPLEFELVPAPTRDSERAVVSLAIARTAALRGDAAEAVEAALIALALDPLQDEALAVVAEAWEQQGDIGRALEWYERYLETLPEAASEQRNALERYIEALRQQRD